MVDTVEDVVRASVVFPVELDIDVVSETNTVHFAEYPKSIPGAVILFPSDRVKSMQRSGSEAIRTQLQPLKPKREITNITNSQNTKRTYGQPSEQLSENRDLKIRT